MSVQNVPLYLSVADITSTNSAGLQCFEDFTPVVGGKHYVAFDNDEYNAQNPVQITVKSRTGRLDYARRQQTKNRRSVSISVPVNDSFNNPTYATLRIELDTLGNEASIAHLRNLGFKFLMDAQSDMFWKSGVAA